MLENPINEKINLVIRQLMASGVQVSTPAQAYEIIFNPKRNGLSDADMAPFQRQWLAVEEETKQMIARNTYQRLLYGTVKANELDKKSMYNDYVATATSKSLSSLSASSMRRSILSVPLKSTTATSRNATVSR